MYIIIKTFQKMNQKAPKQDWDGTLVTTNHFHITTLHKYSYRAFQVA